MKKTKDEISQAEKEIQEDVEDMLKLGLLKAKLDTDGKTRFKLTDKGIEERKKYLDSLPEGKKQQKLEEAKKDRGWITLLHEMKSKKVLFEEEKYPYYHVSNWFLDRIHQQYSLIKDQDTDNKFDEYLSPAIMATVADTFDCETEDDIIERTKIILSCLEEDELIELSVKSEVKLRRK